EADVLDRRLGAVARTADSGHLDLVRREQLFEAPFQLDPHAGRVLRAEAAEVGANARLHHAHALGVRLTGRHPQVGPYAWQIGFLDAQQVDSLAAGDLHHRHLVLVGNVGDAAKFVRARDAAANARNHRERAVLLNVGVHAIV